MGGFAIRNIKPFIEDDSSQAASDAQKNDVINFGYFHTERGELKRLINEVGYFTKNVNVKKQQRFDRSMVIFKLKSKNFLYAFKYIQSIVKMLMRYWLKL